MFFGVIMGYLGHQTRPFVLGKTSSPATANIALYGIGVIISLPVFLVMRRGLSNKCEANMSLNGLIEKDTHAFMTSFLSVAIGVILGYITD
jgi:hypothetical protein